MKKVLSLFMILFMIPIIGCKEKTANYDFDFVNIGFTRSTEVDTEYICFRDDGSFSYYCACGDPVNDSDLCDYYTYDPEAKIIKLKYFEKTDNTVSEIIVKEYTDNILVLDFNGDIRTFTREEEETEYVTPETICYQDRTYNHLKFNEDIFFYEIYPEIEYEENTVKPITNEKWDIVYYNGDLFILDSMTEAAQAYYSDDKNFSWRVVIDFPDLDNALTSPISVSAEDAEYIYSFKEAEKNTTISFDNIEIFGAIERISNDNLICASTCIAFSGDDWYWRSEIIDYRQENTPEYVFKLPQSINEQIKNLNT